MTCYKCKRQGHIARFCRCRDDNLANFSEEKENLEESVYSCQTVQGGKEGIWIVDSGYTNHMATNSEIFRDVHLSYQANICIGHGCLAQAQGKGRILVKMEYGLKFIRDVLSMPNLKHNLLIKCTLFISKISPANYWITGIGIAI